MNDERLMKVLVDHFEHDAQAWDGLVIRDECPSIGAGGLHDGCWVEHLQRDRITVEDRASGEKLELRWARVGALLRVAILEGYVTVGEAQRGTLADVVRDECGWRRVVGQMAML